jgi:membrane protein YdbS with pleckstrin-like domain
MPQTNELKPDRTAFLIYRFTISSIITLVVLTAIWVAAFFLAGISVIFLIIALVLIIPLKYYLMSIRYRKERYVFLGSRIIHKSGSIFSDRETELIVRNITHVTMRLPFIENRLFSTGSISIESAGSGISEIFLVSIPKPKETYEKITQLMKANGFSLQKKELVQKERPSVIGVFFEVFKTFFGTLFSAFLVLAYIGGNILAIAAENIIWVFPILAFAIFILLLRSLFQFLDLKNRVYFLYADTITYKEGFLSRNYSFIPIENLADSTLTQTLIDKIFSLYDVRLSCQGTKQEIHFKNMKNGPKLESNIDNIIDKTESLASKKPTQAHRSEEKREAEKADAKERKLDADTSFTAEFRMDAARTIVPIAILSVVFFPLILFGAIGIIGLIIKISTTRFLIKARSVEKRYNFLTQKNTEFTNEKIMAVIIKENFIDKMFNTCSIHFWSIGSSEDIQFTNIKKTKGLYDSILAKSGIRPKDEIYKIQPRFTFFEMLKTSLPLTIFFLITSPLALVLAALASPVLAIIPASIILLLIIILIIVVLYKRYYYSRSRMTFSEEFVNFRRGIFFQESYYSLYDNIKDITTTRYPFSRYGSIRFNIAGEHIVQQGKNQSILSNSFKINYVNDIGVKDELLDTIFHTRPGKDKISKMEKDIADYIPENIMLSKPDIANTLFILILISVILFPLIILLPITLPLAIWRIRVRSYIIQPYRVISKSGILYKKQTSVVFSKIDHINSSQGMLNKMFKNGNITVNTTGSSSPELVINNIHDYREFFDVLKKNY